MFTIDVYDFCESVRAFTRPQLSRFIFDHRESERFARHCGMTQKAFAILAAKEFIVRNCTLGYLDFDSRQAWVKSRNKRPFSFDFRTLEGPKDKYIRLMVGIGEMSDDEIFKGC